ncbi:MAG: dihydropteroate synthase [Dehalococcoidales bacterium]|nr:dihydropteroate synthase [Dehalococcoidales bacterium]
METKLTSATREVIISDDRPTVLIGERINPAGKKKLAESLKASNMDIVRKEAVEQVKAGADVLDVNVTVFGMDEVPILPMAVKAVMEVTDVPLCIDSANPEALIAALKIYKGKPLINSVSGEKRSLERVLPLIKEYGAAVVGLTQDDNGIPKDAQTRVEIAEKIVNRAEQIGIPREDIVIDCLALAVGADPRSAVIALETIHEVKARLGVNMTLGASNISYGMPDRLWINYSYLAMTIAAGVTCPVVDVAKVRPSVLATDLLLARDKRARRYIDAFRFRQSQTG